MNDTTPPLAELIAVTHRYGHGPDVLAGLNLAVHRGETLAIVGPSGCGKSTLLNLLGTLDQPTAGSVRIAGEDPAGFDDARLAALRREKIGFVFQQHHLLPQCSIWENVLIPTLPGKAAQAARDRADRLLDRVGLTEKRSAMPGELSGGQRQRIAVVRALINAPELLLADEPTGSLDRRTADELADLLTQLNQEEGTALVVVTHAEPLAAHMDRQLELRDGKLNEDNETR